MDVCHGRAGSQWAATWRGGCCAAATGWSSGTARMPRRRSSAPRAPSRFSARSAYRGRRAAQAARHLADAPLRRRDAGPRSMKLVPRLADGEHPDRRGNSPFQLDIERGAALAEEEPPLYLDAGTSGVVWGLDVGYCLMVGWRALGRSSTSSRFSRRWRLPATSYEYCRRSRVRSLREDGPQWHRVRH